MTYDLTVLERLGAEIEQHDQAIRRLRPEFHAEILAARAAGVGTVEVAKCARITRDAVRQLVNRAQAAAE